MDDYRRSHVPAFGSWDYTGDLPFTQCFESARQAGLLRHSYSEDRDLYVAGDLYDNHVLTPAMIVVPRRRRAKARDPHVKEAKKENHEWVVCDTDDDMKQPSPPPRQVVDEDLYKISPGLLHQKSKRNRTWCLFSSCLLPICY
ncbi:uncharacterized protein LOC132269194 [Cornus florida]|uniref:uncharacterized protein LOC132269194 n=1 Tax=Cornus florida TaxID=4283 RepID=UPI0028A2BC8C|nr:uncharacterized protein LOC132269194 [Cornus florida]